MPGDDGTTETVLSERGVAASEEGTFVVRVTEGPDRGKTIAFDASAPSSVLVGTSPACQLQVADREVSRRHASLEVVPGGIRLTDLDSTNGTFVDRVRVYAALLSGGEIVRVGSTSLSIDLEESRRRAAVPIAESFGRVLGRSLEMRRLYPLCVRLAKANVPLVIEGETGTGKELLAEAMHEEGPRAAAPFVVFDCTAAPPTLVESELFGHERGAFTGAIAARRGVFEQAHGGTLLIDEIGDLELSLQAKLLRAIERGEIRRIGGDKWLKVDVRVLAATRRDLDKAVAAGRFRDDLFHRLAVARIELPPLRKRHGDIALIATTCWQELGGDPREIPADVLSKWEEEPWPGNVRELRNAVARQLALGELASQALRSPDSDEGAALPMSGGTDALEAVLEAGLPFIQARGRLVAEFERRYVERVLRLHGGDVAKAAAASGIGRRYFQMLRAKSRG
ncbi:MAG TPA: sigma 54-interacting transcriptional regulator [Labilithrix sp.]